MVLLGIADEISAHFIDCGMVSCSVSLWAVLVTKVLARWASIGSTSCGDGNSWLAASLSLICCITSFLSLQGSQLPFLFVFTGTFSLQSSLSFTNSLSSTPGTISLPPFSQPFAPLFCCLCSTSSSLPFVSVPSPIFLLLR